MNTEIVAIGNPIKIKEIIGGLEHAEDDGVFVVSVPSTQHKSVVASLARENIKAVSYKQFLKTIQTTQKYTPLQKIDSGDAFSWFRTGLEFFCTTYASSFEMYSVDRRDVRALNKVEPITKCVMSNNGAIYGFVRGASASFHINESLDLILDMKLGEAVESIAFDPTDSFVALTTTSSVALYNLFTGRSLGTFGRQPFYFTGGSIYLGGQDQMCRLGSAEIATAADRVSKMALGSGRGFTVYNKNRMARFVDGKIQSIIYDDTACVTSKTHTYVKDVQFMFAASRLYALITKNTGSHDQFILESFLDGKITALNLESRPEAISVGDDLFVVQDSNFEVGFFSRDGYVFRRVKSIRKDGPVTIALRNSTCAIYDSESGCVEFYDRAELRSVYSHQGCANLLWSQSGLYLASFSTSGCSGCLVQVFDSNGALMFKKVFSCLSDFSWRPYAEFDEPTRKRILQEHELGDVEEDAEEEKNTGDLLAEWKSYLLSKIQAISR